MQKHWKSITLPNFWLLAAILDFEENDNSFAGLFLGSSSMSCQILSESDEPDPSYCKNINFAGSSSFPFSFSSSPSCDKAGHRALRWQLKNGQNLTTPKIKLNFILRNYIYETPILDFEIFETCHATLKVFRDEKQ